MEHLNFELFLCVFDYFSMIFKHLVMFTIQI